MPVYEYECAKCGTTTEALRRMADADEPIACEKCGSTKTARAHSVFCCSGESGAAAGTATPAAGRSGHGGGCGCCRH